jgi:hypothetical protein
VIGNVIDDLFRPFDGRIEMAPLGLAASVILAWHGLFRYRVLDLQAVPQHVLFQAIRDGMIVLDGKHRIIDCNQAAAQMLPELSVKSFGQQGQTLSLWPQVQDLCGSGNAREKEIAIARGAASLYFDVSANPFTDSAGHYKGCLLQLQDVTERHKAQADKELLVQQLQAALGEVKTLSGLLPICSSCKRIRDKSGNWEPLEHYINKNTSATLTHGLCPHCAHSFLSEFADMQTL